MENKVSDLEISVKEEFEKMAKTLTKEKVEKVFQKCDENGDGKIDYSEFKRMMDMNKKK